MLSLYKMDRTFETFDKLLASTWGSPSTFAPPVDVQETESGYTLTFDVPGVDEKDLAIEVKDQILTISGERKNGQRYSYSERQHGRFKRSFSLPHTCDQDAVDAQLANGVLVVQVGRKPELKPRRIEVQRGAVR